MKPRRNVSWGKSMKTLPVTQQLQDILHKLTIPEQLTIIRHHSGVTQLQMAKSMGVKLKDYIQLEMTEEVPLQEVWRAVRVLGWTLVIVPIGTRITV